MSIAGISNAPATAYITPLKNTASVTSPTASAPAPQSDDASPDFTHMTPQAMLETMNSLIKSGKMSVDESSGIMGIMPTPLSKNYQTAMNQPMDFIAGLTQQLNFNQSIGNSSGAAYDQKGLDALTRLQGSLANVNIMA